MRVVETILAVVVALLAIPTGMLVSFAPTPRPGHPITARNYEADVGWLRESRKNWANMTDAVHVAADQLAGTFVRSRVDGALDEFLATSAAATAGRWGQVWHYAKRQAYWGLQHYLGWSQPDASGFLEMASLYVASETQLRALVLHAVSSGDGLLPLGGGRSLLDVGSADGTETMKVAAVLGIEHAWDVAALESSGPRRDALRAKGFVAAANFDDPAIQARGSTFSAASLLNVLDRCDDPTFLLDASVHRVAPGGLLLLATVLPFGGHVHEGFVGSRWGRVASRRPKAPLALHEPLPKHSEHAFESGAACFLDAVLSKQPRLKLAGWSKLPYVSSGDTWRTHYTLDIAVMALRVGEGTAEKGQAGGQEANAAGAVGAAIGEAPAAAAATRGIPTECVNRGGSQIYDWLASTLASDGVASWGNVLDAGAGFSSMCWLLHRDYGTVTEVTAATGGRYGANDMTNAVAALPEVDVVLGNWRDRTFLPGRQFDVVVADYLLGATERHWAYGADAMVDRLLATVRPGGYLLVVGLEPYELVLDRGYDLRDRLVLDIEAIGDAAATVAGKPTYRELPETWVRHQIERHHEFRVVDIKQFAMRLSALSLRKQLNFATDMTGEIGDDGLQAAYTQRIAQLTRELENKCSGTHTRARNYALVARRNSSA